MAVAFDAVSAVNATAVSSASWTHAPNGTPTAVAVLVAHIEEAGNTLTSITYGGSNVPIVQTGKASIGGLANPASGSKTVVVNFSGDNKARCSAVTVTGSDTSTCFSNSAKASGSSTSPSVACTSATGELVVDVLRAALEHAPTVGAGQTQRDNAAFGNGFNHGATSTEPGASSVTMSWTLNYSTAWEIAAASFKAAAAEGGSPFRGLLTLGVGA